MEAPVYRPPSEGRSYLIQVTIGCSNNKCTYCAMYRSKTYRLRPIEEIKQDIDRDIENSYAFNFDKVFFCDGDALGAPTDLLIEVASYLKSKVPSLRRIGTYATAENILEKSQEELVKLKQAGLGIAYLGMETGSDLLLKKIVKGNTRSEMIEASQKIIAAGWKLSVIAMLGIGGQEWTDIHRNETATALSQMSPTYFSFLTTVAIPGTPYFRMVEKGLMNPLTVKELLAEMRDILAGYDGGSSIFRANHVSNMFPLAGVLPKDREALVSQVNRWYEDCPSGTYPNISPERM